MENVKAISPHSGDLILMVGTVKGAFILHSDRKRGDFKIAGPYCERRRSITYSMRASMA